jgi:hypothetical protein
MKRSRRTPKVFSFRFIPALALVLLCSACGQSDGNPFVSASVDREAIKSLMIANYLSEFDKPVEIPVFIPNSNSDSTLIGQPVGHAKADKSEAFVAAWRAKVAKPWEGIKDSDLDRVCEFFYGGFSDPTSTFAKFFADAQNQLEAGGLVIHSIRNIRMVEDNRTTIEYPTENFSTSLFVCKADIIYKSLTGVFTPTQDSTLAWNYYVKGDEVPFTFNFQSKKK